MRSKYYFIIALLSMMFTRLSQLALAANVGNRTVELSTPVGRDILPAGTFEATEIRGSFLFSKLIPFVIKYGLRLAVALCVIALIVGGFRLITSYADPEAKEAAIKNITYALVGLLIAIVAFGAVTIISNFTFS